MSEPVFRFKGMTIAFRPGESVAAALEQAGVRQYGTDALGQPARYFCGIGACQGCLARIDGIVAEACLTPAQAGLVVESVGDDHG